MFSQSISEIVTVVIVQEIIMAGIESALLKYDSLEVYVARNKLGAVKNKAKCLLDAVVTFTF